MRLLLTTTNGGGFAPATLVLLSLSTPTTNDFLAPPEQSEWGFFREPSQQCTRLLRFMRYFYTVTLVFAAIYLALAPTAVKQLEAATKQQCATQDWPVHQHQAHINFCQSEGYAVGTR
jgi:hypothetical protein